MRHMWSRCFSEPFWKGKRRLTVVLRGQHLQPFGKIGNTQWNRRLDLYYGTIDLYCLPSVNQLSIAELWSIRKQKAFAFVMQMNANFQEKFIAIYKNFNRSESWMTSIFINKNSILIIYTDGKKNFNITVVIGNLSHRSPNVAPNL